MKRKQRPYLILLFLFFYVLSGRIEAQNGARISAISTRHDLGTIDEKDGPVTYDFEFTNSGSDTLIINKIRTSIDYLAATVTSSRIPPDGKGMIRTVFNPKDQSGKVERYISLRSNDIIAPVKQFVLTANIIPMARTLAEHFPVKIGNLWFKTRHLAFDTLMNTETRTDTFKVYNAWKKSMDLHIKDAPDYTKWVIKPQVLPPGSEGFLIVTYNAGKSQNWGLGLNTFTLLTNDSLEQEKSISIGYDIHEDFSYLKGERANKLPVAEFEVTSHNFGVLSSGVTAAYTFVVRNKGNADLIIRKAKPTCGCTVANVIISSVKPGEMTKINVLFNTAGLEGSQAKSILVYSNDPKTPLTILDLTADVHTK